MQPDRPVWTGVPINPVTHLGSWETEEGIRWSWWHLLTVASQSLCEPLGGGAHWGYTLAGQHTTNRQRWGARRVQWQFRTRPPSSSRRGKQQCSTCAPPESPGSWSWRSRQKLGTALWAQPLWWVWKARPQLPSKRQVCEQASEAGQSADGNEAGIWEQLAPPTEQPASQGERGHDHLTCCAPDSQLTSSFLSTWERPVTDEGAGRGQWTRSPGCELLPIPTSPKLSGQIAWITRWEILRKQGPLPHIFACETWAWQAGPVMVSAQNTKFSCLLYSLVTENRTGDHAKATDGVLSISANCCDSFKQTPHFPEI